MFWLKSKTQKLARIDVWSAWMRLDREAKAIDVQECLTFSHQFDQKERYRSAKIHVYDIRDAVLAASKGKTFDQSLVEEARDKFLESARLERAGKDQIYIVERLHRDRTSNEDKERLALEYEADAALMQKLLDRVHESGPLNQGKIE